MKILSLLILALATTPAQAALVKANLRCTVHTFHFAWDKNTGARVNIPITPYTDLAKEIIFDTNEESTSDSLEHELDGFRFQVMINQISDEIFIGGLFLSKGNDQAETEPNSGTGGLSLFVSEDMTGTSLFCVLELAPAQ